jgi:hypothetical protein
MREEGIESDIMSNNMAIFLAINYMRNWYEETSSLFNL